MRKAAAIMMTLLVAGLMFLLAGCSPEVPPTPQPPTPSPAVKLAFSTQPAGAVAGLALGTQPVVAVQDAQGNLVTGYRGLIELTITEGTSAGGAHLLGGTTVRLVNGIGEFKGIAIDKAAGYTLTATGGTLTAAVSSPFTISPGAPAKLEFTTQPGGAVAGAPLATQPQVTVRDTYGNTVVSYEGSVTLALRAGLGPPDAVLSGTTTVKVVNNVARFTDLSINKSWTSYGFIASSGSLAGVISTPIEIIPGAPVKLAFSAQPSGGFTEIPLFNQPTVLIQDKYNNVVTESSAPITVTITANTGAAGAVLSGKTTVNATRGQVTFTDLTIDLGGTGYSITCASSGLTPVTSQPFDLID